MHTSFFFSHTARLLALCTVLLALAGSFALTPQTALAAQGGETRVVSQKMVYDSERNQVVFEGKVHVIRPDMEIWADKLTLLMDNNGKAAAPAEGASIGVQSGKVERIIAEKNVRIKQDNKTGTCGKATYFVNQGKILMEQDPVIVDGDNRIRGKLITFYTETGRSEVTGNVDVRFTTEEGKTNPFTSSQPGTAKPADKKGATQ